MKQIISTKNAPAAIGPYSQAVSAGNLIYTSGQIPIDPASGEIVSGGLAEQTRQVLYNLKAVLESAGSGLNSVIKTTVFLKDLDNFVEMNAVYSEFFSANAYPARSAVEVSGLPKGALVEIEAVSIRE